MYTGKSVLCLKAQLQNNCINYKFNLDLHNLSLMRGTISRGLLRWKLEMRMTFENRLYCYREKLEGEKFQKIGLY